MTAAKCTTHECGGGGQLRRGMCKSCYERWRVRQHAYGRFESQYVDASKARTHITQLREVGVSWRQMELLTGVNRKQLTTIYRGADISSHRTVTRILSTPIPAGKHVAAADYDRVPSIGATRRLQAMVANGWTQTYIAQRLGMTVHNLGVVVHGHQAAVSAQRDRDIRALFNELEVRKGPSTRARNLGVKHGWALPLEWDEEAIDDPAGEPIPSRRTWGDARKDAAAERRGRVRELTEQGLSAEVIASQLKVSTRQIVRDRSAA